MSKPLTVKVSRRHQITLPREVRERLKIQPGDRLRVEVRNGALLLMPHPQEPAQQPGDEPHAVQEEAATYEATEQQASSRRVSLALSDEQWRYLEKQAEAAGKSLEQVLAQVIDEWIAWRRTLEQDPIRRLFGAIASGDSTTSERVDEIVYSQRADEFAQSPHWYEQLQVVARKRGVSVADLIRDILEASEAYTTTRRLEAVERLAQMSLPVTDWEQMERESTT